jgi:hypothetical protein
MKKLGLALIAALGLTACNQPAQQNQTAQPSQSHFEQLANLPFSENRPTADTAQTLKDELLFQRATQTYLWAMPLINTLGMKVGSEEKFGAGYNGLHVDLFQIARSPLAIVKALAGLTKEDYS